MQVDAASFVPNKYKWSSFGPTPFIRDLRRKLSEILNNAQLFRKFRTRNSRWKRAIVRPGHREWLQHRFTGAVQAGRPEKEFRENQRTQSVQLQKDLDEQMKWEYAKISRNISENDIESSHELLLTQKCKGHEDFSA